MYVIMSRKLVELEDWDQIDEKRRARRRIRREGREGRVMSSTTTMGSDGEDQTDQPTKQLAAMQRPEELFLPRQVAHVVVLYMPRRFGASNTARTSLLVLVYDTVYFCFFSPAK
jgi:PhoPQ-activated pathogenicity-related protein